MTELFLELVNRSVEASWLVLAVLVLRLVLRRAPKWTAVLLWALVGLRLTLPFTVESALSLLPSSHTVQQDILFSSQPAVHSGVGLVDRAVNPVLQSAFTPDPAASANPLQLVVPVLALVWAVGVAVLAAYTAFSWLGLRRRLAQAVLLRDNIYQSERVVSPFVFGLARPGIYLPFSLDSGTMEHVIAHEQAHIARRDHWWKPLGFAITAVPALTNESADAFIADTLASFTLNRDGSFSYTLPGPIPEAEDGKTRIAVRLNASFSAGAGSDSVQSLEYGPQELAGKETVTGRLELERGELAGVAFTVSFETELGPDARRQYAGRGIELVPPFRYGQTAGYAGPTVGGI